MTTGRGILMFPYLFSPDTKFDSVGVYTVQLRLQGDPAAKLKGDLESVLEEHIKEVATTTGKKPEKVLPIPMKNVTDDAGVSFIEFRFKMKPSFKSKTGEQVDQRPQVFDSKLQPLTEESCLGSGSEGKVSFDAVPYNTSFGCGITLRLRAVQIIDLVQYNGGNSASSGFEIEEGFVEDESKVAPAAATKQEAPQAEGNASDF